MLPDKPWKPEAIVRLFLSVVVCLFAGSTLVAALQYGVHHPTLALIKFYSLLVGSFILMATALILLRRGWTLEDSMLRVAIILSCFYGGLTLGALAATRVGNVRPSIPQMIISALSIQGAFLVLLIPFLQTHQVTWSEAFGLKNRTLKAIGIGMAVGGAFVPIGFLLQAICAQLMTLVHVNPEQQQVVQTLQTANASLSRTVFGLISILLVPPAEEGFFRGILFPWIRSAGFPRFALWITSILFGAIHLNLASFIPLTLFAVVLSMLYERTGNLIAPISAHALFNAANLVQLYLLERVMK